MSEEETSTATQEVEVSFTISASVEAGFFLERSIYYYGSVPAQKRQNISVQTDFVYNLIDKSEIQLKSSH